MLTGFTRVPMALGLAGILLLLAPSVSASQPRYSSFDTCSEVRTFFYDAREFFPADRIQRQEDLLRRQYTLDDFKLTAKEKRRAKLLAPSLRPNTSIRQAAARETRSDYLQALEEMASRGWPVTSDGRLQRILSTISEDGASRNAVISLGSYCRAGTYVGLTGR